LATLHNLEKQLENKAGRIQKLEEQLENKGGKNQELEEQLENAARRIQKLEKARGRGRWFIISVDSWTRGSNYDKL
jgi:septal ring factor EnvC (AmiA/AmiB activator)